MSVSIPRAVAASVAMAAIACVPSGVQAAGFYVEPGIGLSSIGGIDKSDLDDAMVEVGEEFFDDFALNDSSLDKSDTGFSIAVGYQVTQNVAVEAAWYDLGKGTYSADVTADAGGGPVDLTTGFTFESSGPAVALVGIWPAGRNLSVDARAGVYFAKTTGSVFVSDGVDTESEALDSEKDTPYCSASARPGHSPSAWA